MKKTSILLSAIAGLVLLAYATPTFAADAGKGKEMTITGEAKCAKCMLNEGDKCQTVIQAENKKGKMVNYYVMDNDVSKAFHENVCKAAKKVTATGTVEKVGGKNEFTVTKIDLAN
jgi:hypothetical protein